MKTLALSALVCLMSSTAFASASADKTAINFCDANKECIDIIAMELDGMYRQGLNESKHSTDGVLINRKARALNSYCMYAKNKDLCEQYKNQLMLQYITGLLNR